MIKSKFKNVMAPTSSLFFICLIVAILLAGTKVLTNSKIKNQQIKVEQDAQKTVLPNAKTLKNKTFSGTNYSIGLDESGKIIGYIFFTNEKGYGGTIKIMVGITTEEKIAGIKILSHNETPGLGANITNEKFINQFCKNIPQSNFTLKDTTPSLGNKINAITGATISSNAVTTAVNDAIDLYKKIISQGGNLNE